MQTGWWITAGAGAGVLVGLFTRHPILGAAGGAVAGLAIGVAANDTDTSSGAAVATGTGAAPQNSQKPQGLAPIQVQSLR